MRESLSKEEQSADSIFAFSKESVSGRELVSIFLSPKSISKTSFFEKNHFKEPANLTTFEKAFGSREDPPTSPPSMSGWDINETVLEGFMLPP